MSSSLGIVIVFIGVTLDFPIINVQNTSRRALTMRKYEHCPYPEKLASEKWCSSLETMSPNSLGATCLCILMSASAGNSSNHQFHRVAKSSESGSSHPTFSLDISCRICFPIRVNGAIYAIGSNMEATVDRIPLLVFGLTARVTRK